MLIFAAVLHQAKVMDSYRQKGEAPSKFRLQNVRSTAAQSCLYVGAFLVTALPLSIARMFQAKYNCTSEFYPLSVATVTFFPLQGFLNCLIYMRPRYINYRQNNPNSSIVSLLWKSIKRTIGRDNAFLEDSDYRLGLVIDEGSDETLSCGPSSSVM